MSEGDIDIESVGELGKDCHLEGVVTCPECGLESRITPEMEAHGRLLCPCGKVEFEIGGTGLRDAQSGLGDLGRSLEEMFDVFK